MDSWVPVIWIALVGLCYFIVIIGLEGLPMHARRRPRRIKWWVWTAKLAVGFAAVAVGLGWFLVIAVGLTWTAVELFARTCTSAPAELDAKTLASQSRPDVEAALRDASSSELCSLWIETGQQMRHTYLPSTLCSYAELRRVILDELTARDPEGVSRWLGDDPDRRDLRAYLHDPQR